MKTPFIQSLQHYYDASVTNLDFSDSGALAVINQWCADNTNDLIKKFLDRIDPDARLIHQRPLFQSESGINFDKTASWQGLFTNLSGSTDKSLTWSKLMFSYTILPECGNSRNSLRE